MASVLRVPTPLRAVTKGKDVLDVPCGTLEEALSQLDARYPGIKDRLIDENGEVRAFINIFLNGDDVTYLQGLHTRIGERDEIDIVPSVAGGQSVLGNCGAALHEGRRVCQDGSF